MKKIIFTLLITTFSLGQSYKDLTERPVYNPLKSSSKIIIDGDLSEIDWINAQIATDFTDRGIYQGLPSPYKTEAKITYDDKNLYVAFIAYVDRENLTYTITNRDEVEGNDDRVYIAIDTFDDESLTYGIGVSAGNIQVDGREGYGFDTNLDIIYDTAVQIFDDRYQAEFSIPFSSLRYSLADIQTWRISFGRLFTTPDMQGHFVHWANQIDGIECQTCQLGFLKDLDVPQQSSRETEFIPSIVGGYSEDKINNTTSSNDEASLFAKYYVSSVDLLEVALNPDFSQIESDDIQNDINEVNALFFPERRPFFSEGAELFKFDPQRGYINLFYSRTINDPSVVGKFTGKIGKTSYGIISAKDKNSSLLLPFEETSTLVNLGESQTHVLRLKRMLKYGSHIGAFTSIRNFEGAGNIGNVGLDLHSHPGGNWHLSAHIATSSHEESENGEYAPEEDEIQTFDNGKYTTEFDGESISGYAIGFNATNRTRTDGKSFTARLRSPGFRTSNGFERNNSTKWFKFQRSKSIYHDNDTLLKSSYTGVIVHKENYDGRVVNSEYELKANYEFANTLNLNLSYEYSDKVYKSLDFKGMNEFSLRASIRPSSKVLYYTTLSFRDQIIRYIDTPIVTNSLGADFYTEYQLSDNTQLSLGLGYEDAKDFFDGYLLNFRAKHAFNPKLSLRSKIQYSDFSKSWFIEPLLTYQPSAFSAFYFGINELLDVDDNIFSGISENNRQFFIKFQYLF